MVEHPDRAVRPVRRVRQLPDQLVAVTQDVLLPLRVGLEGDAIGVVTHAASLAAGPERHTGLRRPPTGVREVGPGHPVADDGHRARRR
ncbi:hypothetical protein SDC9_75527 [bioreactor metagenome]|uniref:Uncharacterized protein n=1 Tax=bioreactor metagenome TaxID=1076179 RepID=A0A644YKZ1_9ZZZZ